MTFSKTTVKSLWNSILGLTTGDDIITRSGIHDKTSKNGVRVKDPKGAHLTIYFKNEDQISNKTHSACHGYVPHPNVWELVEVTDEGEKQNNVKRRSGAVVRPTDADLDIAPDVGYSHLE